MHNGHITIDIEQYGLAKLFIGILDLSNSSFSSVSLHYHGLSEFHPNLLLFWYIWKNHIGVHLFLFVDVEFDQYIICPKLHYRVHKCNTGYKYKRSNLR